MTDSTEPFRTARLVRDLETDTCITIWSDKINPLEECHEGLLVVNGSEYPINDKLLLRGLIKAVELKP